MRRERAKAQSKLGHIVRGIVLARNENVSDNKFITCEPYGTKCAYIHVRDVHSMYAGIFKEFQARA